jgi:hypothetical protein
MEACKVGKDPLCVLYRGFPEWTKRDYRAGIVQTNLDYGNVIMKNEKTTSLMKAEMIARTALLPHAETMLICK